MNKITSKIKYIVRKSRWPWVKMKILLKRKLGWLGIPKVYPYIGYSNGTKVYLSGSVVEDRGLTKPKINQSKFSNLLSMIKRYAGDEFAGVRLRIEFSGDVKEVETSEEGFFNCTLHLSKPVSDNAQWTRAKYILLDKIGEKESEMSFWGDVLMVTDRNEFLIISDVDDTFLVSHSTRFLKKIMLILFKNAITRLPFPGVAEFYKALQKGSNRNSFNPIFYVSSSERNLYDLLIDFCEYRGIPKGPFLLRNMQISLVKLINAGGGNHQHKLDSIRRLLEFFPFLPFLLIGDSGQRDPEIYLQAIREFPGRISVVYIRMFGNKRRIKTTRKIAQEAQNSGVEMVLVKNTEEASKHASKLGLINNEIV